MLEKFKINRKVFSINIEPVMYKSNNQGCFKLTADSNVDNYVFNHRFMVNWTNFSSKSINSELYFDSDMFFTDNILFKSKFLQRLCVVETL